MTARELMAQLRGFCARVIRVQKQAVPSADQRDQVESYAADMRAPERQEQTERFQHYGFCSTPPVGSRLLTAAVAGGSNNRVSFASKTPGQGPTDQEAGEVEIFSQAGQRCRLPKDGRLLLTAAAASKDVVINEGTKGAARVDDAVDLGYLLVTPGPNGVAAVAWAPPGSPPPPPPATRIPMTGKISAGSSTVKVGG